MHPILLQLGPLTIYTFGVFVALALLLGTYVFWRFTRHEGISVDRLFDGVLVTILGAIVGGRLGYVLLHFNEFFPHVYRVFSFFGYGGFLYYTALLGGILSLVWYCRNNRLPVARILDRAAIAASFSHMVGLLGAFLSGATYGAITTLPWGVSMIGLPGKRHPVQIIEALVEFIIFLFLVSRMRKMVQHGMIAIYYLFAYSTSRLVIEFLRGDSVYWFGVKAGWFLSLFALLITVLYWIRRYPRKND